MKLLPILCVLGFICGSSPAAERFGLQLIAGQSNAVGCVAAPSELPADDADKQVVFWFREGDPLPDSPQRA